MAKSRHRTTKRGTQKQRAKTHDEYMFHHHYHYWVAMRNAEFNRAMGR
jgi:hypothetical protein